jgi:gliding motility-associated-like protein
MLIFQKNTLYLLNGNRICTVILSLFFYINTSILSAQDILPPTLISPARDTMFECGITPDLIAKLTDWFNSAGGAIATDNSGIVRWQSSLSLTDAITVFNNSSDILCGNKQKVEITFTPVDTTGNKGSSTKASFFTNDTRGPRIINPVPNQKYKCVKGIRDTLIQWIKNQGGYLATDECSNSISWKNFNYSITSGNNIIQSGGGSISGGPYPSIPDGICEWKLNISFIVADECGNESGTPGTTSFSVTDDVAPVFINPEPDITVDCDKVPDPKAPVVEDACDFGVKPVLMQTTTRGNDPKLCDYFNYSINRKWVATDKCGNSSTYTQIITVQDTLKPVVNSSASENVSCAVYNIKPDSLFISFIDNCSDVQVSYTDNSVSQGCTSVIVRTYTLKDVCNNASTFSQNINIIQNVKPTITKPALNQSFSCTSEQDLNNQLEIWLQNMGGSTATGGCGPIQTFAAVKGSYNILDKSTFPGIKPSQLPTQQCPSKLDKFLRYLEVDFVYYDTCGNAASTSAVFGIIDDTKPVINDCGVAQVISVGENSCVANVTVKVPEVTDNCVESTSPIIRKIITNVTSKSPPGPEAIIEPIELKIGPFNASLANPLTDGIINITLQNMDIDDVSEYFNIFDEDGKKIGVTPLGKDQCSSINMTLNLDKGKITEWIKDGYITLKLIPNIIAGNPVSAINHICIASAVEVNLAYEIDVTNTLQKTYRVNNGAEIPISHEKEIRLPLEKGNNTVTFKFTDCANNTSECTIPVTIKDEISPKIICPSDIQTVLPIGHCVDTLLLPINFKVSENCSGAKIYSKKSPTSAEASQLSFVFNETKMKFEARSRELVFENVFPVRHLNLPVVLEVEFVGDNDEAGEYFEIFGPGGRLIGNTALTNVKCSGSKSRFEIEPETFNSWIKDNKLSLLAIPKNGGDGINPCVEFVPGQTVDRMSLLQADLKYSDLTFSISVSGATKIDETLIPDVDTTFKLVLNAGIHKVTIKTTDETKNPAICQFNIMVEDREKPRAKCKNAVITIHPSGIEKTKIHPEMINDNSSDNCSIDTMYVIPNNVDCSNANSDVSVQLVVGDKQGNKDTCQTMVRIKPAELKPSYSAGLCSNDTLKLFANVPTVSTPDAYSFFWDGPGAIDFFTENPAIPNADESYNGVYILTVKGFNNCTTMSSLSVNIKPLIKPELTTTKKEICQGEELILTTTNYSGNIEYLWYEGIFPTGVLLKSTTVPELIIKPTLGVHFYYIVAKGPDCSSNPSSLLKTEVKAIPIPEVCNGIVSLCEGGDLVLCAKGSSNYSYTWSGPAGYTGSGLSPTVINNVSSIHAGAYRLVVANGACVSDTVNTRLVVLEKPAQPSIISADIFCEGASFSLVAAMTGNAEKFEWYKNGVLFTTTQENNLIIPNAQSSLQGSWTLVTIKGNCKSQPSSTKSIAIDSKLEIGAINSGPVCMGDSVKLQATIVPNATYAWQGPIMNIPSVHDPTIKGIPGDYSVTITTPTGCQNNASTTVFVTSVPEITALSNDSKGCMNAKDEIRFAPSVFPNADNYTYLWEGPNGYKSTIKNPIISNLTLKDTGIYSLVIFNGKCPSNKQTTNVKFGITPQKPVWQTAPFFCTGDSIKLELTVKTEGAEYIWNTPLGRFSSTGSVYYIPDASVKNKGKYYAEIKSGSCFSVPSDTILLDVRDKPQIPVIQGTTSVCFGDTIRLSAGVVENAQYRWAGPATFEDKALIKIPNANSSNTGPYALKVTVNGCTSPASLPLNVVVKDEIKVPVFETDAIALCKINTSGAQVCIQPASLEPGATYSVVKIPENKVLATGNQNCFLLTDLSGFTGGSNFIHAFASKNNCNSVLSKPLVININTPPAIKATATEDNIRTCEGENVRLMSVYGPPLVTVKWSAVNSTNQISDRTSKTPVISGLSKGENILYLEYSIDGCPDFTRDTVRIYNEFAPIALDDSYRVAYGSKHILNILQNDAVPENVKINLITPPKYGKVNVNARDIEYIPDNRYLRSVDLVYQICSDFCGTLCDNASVHIDIDDNIECKLPTIFTPNGDGINDYFVAPCLDNGRFPANKLYIFNEWGVEVFSASPYKNDWDGTYGGSLLPVGTYFYVFETGDGQKPINGFLILQR